MNPIVSQPLPAVLGAYGSGAIPDFTKSNAIPNFGGGYSYPRDSAVSPLFFVGGTDQAIILGLSGQKVFFGRPTEPPPRNPYEFVDYPGVREDEVPALVPTPPLPPFRESPPVYPLGHEPEAF